MPDEWQPSASLELIKERARILQTIRAFFAARDVIEVETPILSAACTTDPNIESLETRFRDQRYFLNTSPEYAMKRLLAHYQCAIYQICKVFRDEELGLLHNPEFTMLEWYRPGFDIHALIDEVSQLLSDLAGEEVKTERVTYRKIFQQHVGLDPHVASVTECSVCAQNNNIEIPVGLSANDEKDKDAWLDWLLTQLVIPILNQETFVFIYDYPASQCALAQLQKDETGTVVAKRFELIYRGLELANGFYELLEANEQQQRFANENRLRHEQGKTEAVIDQRLLSALRAGLPQCSGVALGIDRLLMAMFKMDNIENVQAFPWRSI